MVVEDRLAAPISSLFDQLADPRVGDPVDVAQKARDLLAAAQDHLIELTHVDRRRIFNLGYYTWVEQQGVPLEDFERRRDQAFWRELQESASAWDRLIEDFNRETGVNRPA